MAAIKLKAPVKLAKPDPTEITDPSMVLGEPQETYDGEALHAELLNGSTGVDDLHRKQLIAVAQHLGATEEDTRGRPVKMMRELVTTLMSTDAEPEEEAPKPVKIAPKVGTVKKAVSPGPVKLVRRLG